MRLGEVTQVLGADEERVFHNRLTHSSKVAQIARRLAEKLLKEQSDLVNGVGGVDPDVTEAAALAHDLGHPPFGHVAEQELHRLVASAGDLQAFEGNAQSFRIVTALARRSDETPGLNLTRATLNALLKYPWLRNPADGTQQKWGAYETERLEFEWAREPTPRRAARSAEAELMDWADDITYAVHDLVDFYRAGLIPLHRLSSLNDDSERLVFIDALFRRKAKDGKFCGQSRPAIEEGFAKLLTTTLRIKSPFSGTSDQRGRLRFQSGILLARFVDALRLVPASGPRDHDVEIQPAEKTDVELLKQLTWHYVILGPGLRTQQHGQKRMIASLFHILFRATKKGDLSLIPYAVREVLEGSLSRDQLPRIVSDYVAGLKERQALTLYRKLIGVDPGSALEIPY